MSDVSEAPRATRPKAIPTFNVFREAPYDMGTDGLAKLKAEARLWILETPDEPVRASSKKAAIRSLGNVEGRFFAPKGKEFTPISRKVGEEIVKVKETWE